MPTYAGPWITPPVQTATGPMSGPQDDGGSLTLIQETGNVTNADVLNGTSAATVTTFSTVIDGRWFPRDDPTFQNPNVINGVYVLHPEAITATDYSPTWPAGAVGIEYDPANTDTATWIIWPVTLHLTGNIFANFFGGSSATPPADMTVDLRRLIAADYTLSNPAPSTYSARPAAANNWITPAVASSRTVLKSLATNGATDTLSVAFADLDATGAAVFLYCINYFAAATIPTLNLLGSITLSLEASWQARRYRFLYNQLPRLRQFPRDDALGGAPRQGARNGGTSVQSSTRQGWRGTYR